MSEQEPIDSASTEILTELDEKRGRVAQLLEQRNLDGALVSAVRNIAWLTAGRLRTNIVSSAETGVASLLLLRDGRRYVVSDNIETPRLRDEDLSDGALHQAGYGIIEHEWYEANSFDSIARVVGSAKIGSDTMCAGESERAGYAALDLAPLRFSFTASEIERYRRLCRETAQTMARVCREQVAPGMSEYEIAALTASELLQSEITPTVLLVGADERIHDYRHPLPTRKPLARYCMIVVCARRGGLVCAITRLVHFGAPPAALQQKLHAAAQVNATLQAKTRTGARESELFTHAQAAYSAAGHDGEWRHHHQGGAIGYKEREWVARPEGNNIVQAHQAFAWNPSVRGAKVEDTIINYGERTEVLTATPDFPRIEIELDAQAYTSAGILVR